MLATVVSSLVFLCTFADRYTTTCSSGVLLKCGVHACPSKCHQRSDHSKMDCESVVRTACDKKHVRQWKCHQGPPASCHKCDQQKNAAEKKQREEFARQEKQAKLEREHQEKLAELEKQLSEEREKIRDAQLAKDREVTIAQKEKDLFETQKVCDAC